MTLSEARYIAESVVTKLMPVTERVLICGSIRRKRPEVTDIDICVIPKRNPIKDLFGTIIGQEVTKEFADVVNQWPKIKGEPSGKYTQRLLPDGHKLEISMCNENNWGNLCIIRTGDKDFSHKIMTRGLKLGFEHKEGRLWSGDKILRVPNEETYFELLNLPYIKPEDRDETAFRKVQSR